MKLTKSDDQFKIWESRGLRVVCDRERVVPNDPGADTPAMVYYKCRRYEASATYWCATGEGNLEIHLLGGEHRLSSTQLKQLEELDAEITDFLYKSNPKCVNGISSG